MSEDFNNRPSPWMRQYAKCNICGKALRHLPFAVANVTCRDCYGLDRYRRNESFSPSGISGSSSYRGSQPFRPAQPVIPYEPTPRYVAVQDPFDARDEEVLDGPLQAKRNALSEKDLEALFAPPSWWPDEVTSRQRTEVYDRLLQWMSATCSGGIQIFRNTCTELGLDEDGTQASRILRRLRLLGHVETAPDGSRWTVAPPAIVQLVAGDGSRFFLSGARDESLLRELEKWASVERLPMMDGSAPTSIFLTVHDLDGLFKRIDASELKPRLHFAFDVALWFAQRLPTVPEWAQMLEVLPGVQPDSFMLRRHDGKSWKPVALPKEPGFYEFWEDCAEGADDPWEVQGARPCKSLLLLEDGTWRRGDWYGLSFAARHAAQGHCPTIYDSATGQLAVPRAWHWPEFFERALVLASGRLPCCQRVGGQLWLVYEGISPALLDVLESKLNLQTTRR